MPRFFPSMLVYRQFLLLGCLSMTVIVQSGCAQPGPFVKIQKFFIGKKWTDNVPGVTPPRQKVDEIRRLGQRMARAGQPERQQIARELIEAYQKEDDPNIRWEIFRVFGGMKSPEGEALLQLALQDSDPDLRSAACERLGWWQTPDAAERLGHVIRQDDSPAVRLTAIRALGRLKDPGVLPILAELLEHRDPSFQYQAMLALKQVTGQKLGWDAAKWREYLITHYQVSTPSEIAARTFPADASSQDR